MNFTLKGFEVLLIGCFDTKADEFYYLYQCLKEEGIPVFTINIGIFGSTDLFPVDIEAIEVARKGGVSLEELQEASDRGWAIDIMGKGSAEIIKELYKSNEIGGIIGMGGGGGTYMILKGMKHLPIGFPKVCISTLATKDLSSHIGSKDIILFPSIVDIAGVNFINRKIMQQAAKTVGALSTIKYKEVNKKRGHFAISVFGNTTKCADECISFLAEMDYETVSFHAVGTGGRSMEELINQGIFDGVIDLTITELADEMYGGICSAGPDRLKAAGARGIPQVVVPGCLDMVNFGSIETVPKMYKDRLLFQWAPDVTLMRTNEEENRKLGKHIAMRLNQSSGSVIVLFPMGGLSEIGGFGKAFYAPEIDRVLFDSIRKYLRKEIEIREVDTNINTKEFARETIEAFLQVVE